MFDSIFPVAFALTAARFLALCMAVLSAPTALAGENALYKCVSVGGVVSIQSDRCPSGSTQAWRRDATPEPTPTPEQAAQAEAKRQRDQQTVRELSEGLEKKLQPVPSAPATPVATAAAPSPASEQAAIDACQAAQTFASSIREKEWLGLTEDQIRRLYTWVSEQCKTPAPAN